MPAPENQHQLLKRAQAQLAEAGIESARLDGELLLAEALGIERLTLLVGPAHAVDAATRQRFEGWLARRLAHEPMAYILGHREFWSLDFKVTKDTLIPRPDSETLIRAVLEWLDRKGISRGAALRILDLGTGTGCLLLALLSELPGAWGLGVDRSPGALQTARENAEYLGLGHRVSFIAGDWAAAIGPAEPVRGKASFDVIVTNPPYIPIAEIAVLSPEVRDFEPGPALAGGVDGLAAYQTLAPQIFRLLAEEGAAFLEIGAGQDGEVSDILARAGVIIGRKHKDLAGITRCLEGEVDKKSVKA